MASGPGISGSLKKSGNYVALKKCQGISWNSEKSGNFVALGKCQGKIREFREIGKSEGILLVRNKYHRSFFKIHSSGEQELLMPAHI